MCGLFHFSYPPQVGNGYDVADYLAVNPQYGTMEEVEILIAEARYRNHPRQGIQPYLNQSCMVS